MGSEHNRSRVVRSLPLGLGVYSSQIKPFPHQFQEFINVPAMLRADGACIWNPVQKVQFLDGDRIYLVQNVNDGDVAPTLRLKNVDEIINGSITSDGDIR